LLKCQYSLRCSKPPYPYVITTIGDALRKRRSELGLPLKNVAREFNVGETTLRNWESNRRQVSLAFRRRVYEFLGVCPYDPSLAPLNQLRERRKFLGLTRKRLAEIFEVNEHTVSAWEERNQSPTPANMEKISQFLKPLSVKD